MIARFINPLIQYGRQEYELIILDDEAIVDRRHVSFGEKTTDEDMQKFAEGVIEGLKVEVEEISIDKPIEDEEKK